MGWPPPIYKLPSTTDSTIVLFNGVSGAKVKQATGTGFVKAASGVCSFVSSIDLAADVSTTILPLANGGTAKNMTPVNGGIVWTDAGSMEVSAAGTSGQYLVSAGAAAPTWATVAPGAQLIATISDVRTSGTNGGTATTGSWQTRTLQTIVDTPGIVTSLSSNQFTLAAGTYYIDAWAIIMDSSSCKSKIRNITDSTDALIGMSHFAVNTAAAEAVTRVSGQIVIAGSKTFELQSRVAETSSSTYGYGLAASFSVDEIYSVIKITKIQ